MVQPACLVSARLGPQPLQPRPKPLPHRKIPPNSPAPLLVHKPAQPALEARFRNAGIVHGSWRIA